MQLHVELSSLLQSRRDTTNLGYLATDVEVDEAQAILKVHLLQSLKCSKKFGTIQAKLAGIATALLPLATTAGSQLDADTQIRAHTKLGGCICNDFKLGKFLHHEEHTLTHLLSQQSQLDEVLVLMTITDDERVRVHVSGKNGMQLGLTTSLKTKIVSLAMADNLLYHGTHLINLNRIDDEMLTLVVVFLSSHTKTCIRLLDSTIKNIRKTK